MQAVLPAAGHERPLTRLSSSSSMALASTSHVQPSHISTTKRKCRRQDFTPLRKCCNGMDPEPVICLSGQVPTHLIGTDAFQEADTIGISRPCTKHNYLVKDANKLCEIIHKSFEIASSGRPGPVLIDLPKDIQLSNVKYIDKISKIKKHFENKFISEEDILITRERHRQHLLQCVDHLNNFSDKNDKKDFDKAAEDLRLATRQLGMIVGKVDVEEILGSIFNDFCIGK